MPLGTIAVVSQKQGDINIPLYGSPYDADDSTQTFLAESFNAVLWKASSVQTASVYCQTLQTKFCAPLTHYDTTLGNPANDSGHPWLGGTSDAMVLGTYGVIVNEGMSDGGPDNICFVFNAPGKLNSQPLSYSAVAGGSGVAANSPCAPLFAMVQIQNSPPVFVPCIFFSMIGNDVVNNLFGQFLFNPQAVGPPTQIWNGPTIPGGVDGSGAILPKTYTLKQSLANVLTYSDNTLHSLSATAHLPDIDGQMNRWLYSDGVTVPFRILQFLPGQATPGNIVFNQSGWQTMLSFDDAAINTGMSTLVSSQACRKGFLLRTRAAYKAQSFTLVLVSLDGTKYWPIVVSPKDAKATDVISTGGDTQFAFDLNRILYAKKFNSTLMANSFGINPFPVPVPGSILPIGLPCFEPCLPWPIG